MLFPDDIPVPGEEKVVAQIIGTILTAQEKAHKSGKLPRRALHGKSLGVVSGIFTVRPLPDQYRVGVFSAPNSFQAIARFSNGGLGPDFPDILPNVRGLAIKLYGVEGKKILPDEELSIEQDFLMANEPTFIVKDIHHFAHLTTANILAILTQAPGTIGRVIKATSKAVPSLAAIDYFSQVPQRFGDRACKYALIHNERNIATEPNKKVSRFEKDYLRHDLNNRLHTASLDYTFCVQLQVPGESISDSTKEWTGDLTPLADLSFPIISEEIKESDGEALSFNPARSLAEHAPLAWPGRLRTAAYKADFKWRSSHR